MDIVRIVDSAINIQDVFREASVDVSSSVSLFVGRKQTFENNILWPESGFCDRQKIEVLLSGVCETVRSRKCVTRITIYCRPLLSPDDPCIAIACSAANYQQASEAAEETVRCIAELKSNVANCDNFASHMVQVRANSTEMRSRISAFIKRKREHIDDENVRDFCCYKVGPEDENSCARVDSVFTDKRNIKDNLRVRKVVNSWGPQTRIRDNSVNVPDGCVMESKGTEPFTFTMAKGQENMVGVEERLRTLEEHMGLQKSSVPGDVYSRLKKVEDRILHLEGVSPEYVEFWGKVSPTFPSSNEDTKSTKRIYTKDDVARKIEELQNKLTLTQQ